MGDSRKVVRHCVIVNKLGLHARPASLLAKTAGGFQSEITIAKDGHVSDAKSIIGLLMLAAGQGTSLSITARGGDAAEALDALEKLIQTKFNEE
ncbi:MAG: hypothetical protein A3K18_08405 [Lentisphaerae bacterium RIFOXYA12_64_32]|nr:MAG: hypothetical protein A3K18_08405 [Lentisphaerae bacterium RIFOXYA12_64_32]